MAKEATTPEYIVTARKWRPLQFKDIVGQEHITTTLQNAIRSGRIHHAYLFSGPRGVGKTTTARIYARALNCLHPIDIEPCNVCESCEAILTSRSLDVIEIDGASNNSVDDIRKLRENAKYPPASGKYKMYIIDEVHMLSTSAFNALLKTLEEPPPHLLFVFATTESHKVPATILSRCQRFDFRRMDIESIAKQLKYIAEQEKIEIDEDSLIGIAKKADGSMRDGQSIFDQVLAFCGKDIKYTDMASALHLIDQEFFFRITTAVKEKNLNEIFTIAREVVTKGYDLQECLGGLLEHLRNILTIQVAGGSDFLETSSSFIEKYKQTATSFSKTDLIRFMNLVANTEQALKFAPQPRVRFELALVQMADMDSALEISELIEEIRELKKKGITSNSNNNSLPAKVNPPPTSRKTTAPVLPTKSPVEETEEIVSDSTEIEEEIFGDRSLTKEYIESRWSEFLTKYAISKHGLYMLAQSDFVRPIFFNGEVVIQTQNDFTAENIKKKRQNLRDFLKEFYGGDVGIKILLDTNPRSEDTLPELEAEPAVVDAIVEIEDNLPREDMRLEEIIAEDVKQEAISKQATVKVITKDLTPV